MLVVNKEIFINREWVNIGTMYVRDPLFSDMAMRSGDIMVRRYSPITRLNMQFNKQEGSVRTIQRNSLNELRQAYGVIKFDKLIGYFPFDTADWYSDKDTVREMSSNYGITGYRLICFWI